MYACESLGYVVEKKIITIIAITQTVLSALFLPLHLNVNEAFHRDTKNMTFIIINLIQYNIKSL
jgi:hypothetical protein